MRSSGKGKKNRRMQARERQVQIYRQRGIVVGIVLLALILLYVLIANSFKTKFLPNTYINQIDVGNRTEEEAENLLRESVENYELTLLFQDEATETLTKDELGYEYVSSGEVAELLEAQQRFSWLSHLFGKREEYDVETSFRFDEGILQESIENLPEFQEENYTSPEDAYLSLTNDFDFEIIPEIVGNMPNGTVVVTAARHAVGTGVESLDLTGVEDAYYEPEVYSNDEELIADLEALNAYLETVIHLYLPDGTKRTISRSSLLSMLERDDDGRYSISSSNAAEYCWTLVTRLANQYNNSSDEYRFESTNHGVKTFYGNSYGYEIDIDAIAEQITNDVVTGTSEEITIESAIDEEGDPTFGGNYVEVDVTEQHVYFYKDGELFLDSDCVTGLESDPERLTPSGLFSIYGKDTEKTLEGRLTADGPVTYSSYVDVWMPFYESYGMHDASWRDEFGGDIYLTQGSHGCVNLPVDVAKTIFEEAPVGTAVIVLRESD